VTNGGTRLGRTFVRRILVGDRGITYRYLGLRTFAHPWHAERGEPQEPEAAVIRELNHAMVALTRGILDASGGNRGSRYDYNLSLINLHEPGDGTGGPLRNKLGVRLGKDVEMAVSWHADSAVEEMSCIGVLNLTQPEHSQKKLKQKQQQRSRHHQRQRGVEQPWRIALKCIGDEHEGGKARVAQGSGAGEQTDRAMLTPAAAVPLHAGDSYFFLREFNHHHHHAVLAGSAPRYSTTHRVGVTATDTWDYIWERAERALALPLPPYFSAGGATNSLTASALRLSEEVHSEIEFEWLRMWAAQGRAHSDSHKAYWAPRINELIVVWLRLEARTAAYLAFLAAAAAASPSAAIAALPEGVRCFDILEHLLVRRDGGDVAAVAVQAERRPRKEFPSRDRQHLLQQLQASRAGWHARNAASVFDELGSEFRPFELLKFHEGQPVYKFEPALKQEGAPTIVMLGEALGPALQAHRAARALFCKNQSGFKPDQPPSYQLASHHVSCRKSTPHYPKRKSGVKSGQKRNKGPPSERLVGHRNAVEPGSVSSVPQRPQHKRKWDES